MLVGFTSLDALLLVHTSAGKHGQLALLQALMNNDHRGF